MQSSSYIIRGGRHGRERLRILSRVMQPTTHDLLQRAGIRSGMTCLEVGSGGGDVAFDMARLVGPQGRVVGTDIDETKLQLARQEAGEHHLSNVEFRLADITETHVGEQFDLVHARFVLTHLRDPAQAVANMRQALRPGGILVIEDIDFRGYFCYPDCPALWRYVELYTQAARRKGADPNIGPRLPALLVDAGLEDIQLNVIQPAGLDGEVKLLTPLTMEGIAEAVLAEGLASSAEIDQLVEELFTFACTPGTLGCTPPIFQTCARVPS